MAYSLKVEGFDGNDSTLVVDRRGTSTPLNSIGIDRFSDELSLSHFEGSFNASIESQRRVHFQAKVGEKTPPIFGRLNIQSHEKRRRTIYQLQPEQENINKKVNIRTSDWDTIIDKETKNVKNRKSSRRQNIYCKPKKRRSDHGDNYQATVAVTPKCAKSPYLLSAMKVRLKHNRERIRLENEKIGLDNEEIDKNDNKDELQRKKEEITSRAYPRKSVKKRINHCTIPMSRKEQEKKFSLGSKVRMVGHNSQEEDRLEITPFKAHPIRKYVPLPVIKARSPTVPISPKLGKRRECNQISR